MKQLILYLEFGRRHSKERPIVPLLWERASPQIAKSSEQAEVLAFINKHQAVSWEKLRRQDSSYQGYREAIGTFAAAIAEDQLLQ